MIVKSFKMNLPMDYSSTVGALTEIASNNLILGVQCQNGTATTAPGVTLTGRARVGSRDNTACLAGAPFTHLDREVTAFHFLALINFH